MMSQQILPMKQQNALTVNRTARGAGTRNLRSSVMSSTENDVSEANLLRGTQGFANGLKSNLERHNEIQNTIPDATGQSEFGVSM